MLRFTLFFLLGVACVQAGGVALNIDATADYALKHNAALAAARLRIDEARGRLLQSGRLNNPELELEYSHMTRGQEGAFGVSLMQRFPLTARLRHEKEVSRAELAAAEAEVRDGERKLAAETRALAVKIVASRGQRELRARQQENSRELSSFLLKRVESGEASGVDAVQVELETQQLELEALQLTATEVALAGELRALLGVAGDVAITGQLAAPTATRDAGETNARPDVQAAEHRAEAAEAATRQQRASRWEDVGVGASYTRERTVDDPNPIETEHSVGVKVTIPLPLWNSNAGRIREAEAVAARAALEATATRFTARTQASAARGEMIALTKLVNALDAQLLPKAAEIEERIRQQYATGQSPLTDVLRARTRRLELQRQRLDALRDYHLARVRYEGALGHSDLSLKNTRP
jgi:cobalt-zinc-cadmium efflux system outer membrane protein